jgi:hypothetical protein
VNNELEKILKEAFFADFRCYLGIRLEELRKATKKPLSVIRSPVRDLSPGPVEYEAGVMPTRSQRSVRLNSRVHS